MGQRKIIEVSTAADQPIIGDNHQLAAALAEAVLSEKIPASDIRPIIGVDEDNHLVFAPQKVDQATIEVTPMGTIDASGHRFYRRRPRVGKNHRR